MTTTTIEYNDGHIVARHGTCGLTITSTRSGDNVGDHVDVKMEFDMSTQEECAALVGTLLTQLEEMHGENLVVQCIAHYAHDTGKVIKRQGKRDLVFMRGYKDGRR
jgi:hypothetical protein